MTSEQVHYSDTKAIPVDFFVLLLASGAFTLRNFSTEEPSTSFIEVGSILEEKELLAKVLEKTKEQADMIDKPKEKPEIGKHEEKVETEAKIEKHEAEPKIDSLEVKKRQEYLRAQRDKLVALKKEARRKQLDVDKGSKDESKSRPKSAKAAQAVLTGVNPSIEYQQLQLRKTLADRLKAEVVAGKK